jgi:hypothetical protein
MRASVGQRANAILSMLQSKFALVGSPYSTGKRYRWWVNVYSREVWREFVAESKKGVRDTRKLESLMSRYFSTLKNGKIAELLLVSGYHPATLLDELLGALVDLGLGGGNLVLDVFIRQRSSGKQTNAGIRTTVKSSNGLASSMFFNVFCRSLSSTSTLDLVCSAALTAWASKASMALIWRLTSYFLGWKALNCFSMSSMTAEFLRMPR